MAIPNSPNWSSLTDVKAYPQPAFAKPSAPAGVAAVSLGPVALNNSQGVLNSRYWLVTQTGNQVQIQGAEGELWEVGASLFNEPLPIQQISLTFDQLGRPLVFYRVGEDTLKLCWYDPIAQESVLTNFGIGKDPTACFDFPQDTGQSFTDVLLFYVRNDQVFMRIQRDRYAIEYPCPAIQPGLKINSAGLRVDNRLQVVYQFKDAGYVPPVVPVPPVEIPGDYRYLQSGWNSGIETPWRMAGPIADTEFEIGMGISGFRHLRREGLASEGPGTGGGFGAEYIPPHTLFAITAGRPANGLIPRYGYPELMVRTRANLQFLELIYQSYPVENIRLNTRPSDYSISKLRFLFGSRLPNNPQRRKLTIYGTFRNARQSQDPALLDKLLYDGDIPTGVLQHDLHNSAFNSRLFFGCYMVVTPNGTPAYGDSMYAYISDCYARDGEALTRWLIDQNGQAAQPSTPIGSDATIINHNPARWRFTQM